jgi:hypothetical protein
LDNGNEFVDEGEIESASGGGEISGRSIGWEQE